MGPLQMIEFNLILKAAKAPIGPAGFWKLLIGTVLMLAFGYAGETKTINPWAGFGLVCAVGPSFSSRSLLVSLPTHLDNHPKPSSSLLTTCASLCHWAGRSTQLATSWEPLPKGLAARH